VVKSDYVIHGSISVFFVEAVIHRALHSRVSLKTYLRTGKLSDNMAHLDPAGIWIIFQLTVTIMAIPVTYSLPVSELYLNIGFQCSALDRAPQNY
jgi:hypothetical protein